MSHFEVLNHQVLSVELQGSHIIKTHYCMVKKVVFIKNDHAVQVLIHTWTDEPLQFAPVLIRITGESADGEDLAVFEDECTDGVIELDTYLPGDKITICSLNNDMDNATMEVTI